MSDTSKSSFSANLTVLIIRKTFWTSYGETLTKPNYDSKDGQFPRYFQDTVRRLQIIVSASPTMVIISAILRSSYGEMFTYQHYDRKHGKFANTVIRFQRIVFDQFHSVYHKSDILELLR